MCKFIGFLDMNIHGYYSDDELMALLAENKITRLDFVSHRSEEETLRFKQYCEDNDLEEDEEAAAQFLEHLNELEEIYHDEE